MKKANLLGAALLGGVGYPVMEILFRGRTHISMAVAGALCLPMMRICARLPLGRSCRALMSSLWVTAIEGLIGSICNQDHRIWDYRKYRGNIAGQVCIRYSALWYGISWLMVFRPGRKKR